MKILTAQQIKQADEQTIEKEGISSTQLMERAAKGVFEEINIRLQNAPIPIKIFCGIGNNGGDGLVIGRLLIEAGYEVTLYVVNYSDQRSANFLINYDRIKNITNQWPVLLKQEEDFPEVNVGDFVIDAIFGVGLNRPLEPWVVKLVQHINKSEAFVLAIDMPSGMSANQAMFDKKAIIQADYTITFEVPKMAFFMPDSGKFVGDLQTLPIGLDEVFLKQTKAIAQTIGAAEARALYRSRSKFSHKGTYGHALVIGGSYGKIGSICLTATAALRAGAGMVTAFIPKCGYNILQTALPEAMVLTDEHTERLTQINYNLAPEVIAFGVGAGTHEESVAAFHQLLKKVEKPMVIDADGLNILAANKEFLKLLPAGSVLTPHPKELERLLGKWKDDYQKLEKIKEFTKTHQVILVLKGTYTFVVTAQEVYINTSGNPGMATAGSGDVLTGIITAFMAQGYESLHAAILGVYLHGSSGDLAAANMGYEGVLAGDIAKNTGKAILELFKPEQPTPTT